jgi:hypothetical protein
MARSQEDGLRTAAKRLGAAHRRMDAELPGDVVRRRDDAAAVRIPADDERLFPQARILELFDRGEEGVEVEVRENHGLRRSIVHSAPSWRR